MTSAIEITKKLVAASVFNKADIGKIIINYMSELLMDMGQRYGMTEITHHILAAAFKIQADFSVQQVSMPIKFKINKSDSAGGH